MCPFRNKATFYCEIFLAPRPPPKLEDNTLSAQRDCLFNIFTANLHIGSRFSIRIPSANHAVVSRTNVAYSYNLRYVSCITWEFITDGELSEIKMMYSGKNTNLRLLGRQLKNKRPT